MGQQLGGLAAQAGQAVLSAAVKVIEPVKKVLHRSEERGITAKAIQTLKAAAKAKLQEAQAKIAESNQRIEALQTSIQVADEEVQKAVLEAETMIETAACDTAAEAEDTAVKKRPEAMQELKAAQEVALKQLDTEGNQLQKKYKEKVENYQAQLEEVRLKQFLDEAEPVARPPKTTANSGEWNRGPDEIARREEVKRVVTEIMVKHEREAAAAHVKAQNAIQAAREAQSEAKKASEVAEETRIKKDRACTRYHERVQELKLDPAQAQDKNAQVRQAGKAMLASGAVDIQRLAEQAGGGSFVWCFTEDAGQRFDAQEAHLRQHASAAHPTLVLIPGQNGMKMEAHYLLDQESGGDLYRFVDINVGGFKKFNQQTGTVYEVDVRNNMQRNKSSGYQRALVRVDAGLLPAGTPLLAQLKKERQAAVDAAAEAQQAALKAWLKAELAEQQKQFELAKAEKVAKGTNASAWNMEYPDGKTIGKDQVPMQWNAMGEEVYMEVPLDPNAAEFQRVKAYFCKSMPQSTKVKSVKRIQNKLLWQLYEYARKRIRQQDAAEEANEEFFFHGANKSKGITEKIACTGFDTQFGGKIWLSTYSGYSSGYCKDWTGSGWKQMLLVRCVLGNIGVDCTHCGSTSRGHTRCDDQHGGGRDNRYTFANHNQLYPAYVIEFQ